MSKKQTRTNTKKKKWSKAERKDKHAQNLQI